LDKYHLGSIVKLLLAHIGGVNELASILGSHYFNSF
jgi:hypothetical protein